MEQKITQYQIGRVQITSASIDDISNFVNQKIATRHGGYICVSNMRTVVVGNTDKEYENVMNESLMNIPDGTPLVWCGKLWGVKNVQRACGPDLFVKLLAQKCIKQYFLGDTDDTLAKLKTKVEEDCQTQVVGVYSPPFSPLKDYDFEGIAKQIKESGAEIVWVSLRAPKQDFFAAGLMPYLEGQVLIGVGAAFRFVLGEYELKKGFLQKIGLAGLFCIRNSSIWKELKWYVKHAMYLMSFMISIIGKRLMGKKAC